MAEVKIVVDGAFLKCSECEGIKPLTVLDNVGRIISGKRVANKMCIGSEYIPCFGQCDITGSACSNENHTPWINLADEYITNGEYALTEESIAFCIWGGYIKVLHCGQTGEAETTTGAKKVWIPNEEGKFLEWLYNRDAPFLNPPSGTLVWKYRYYSYAANDKSFDLQLGVLSLIPVGGLGVPIGEFIVDKTFLKESIDLSDKSDIKSVIGNVSTAASVGAVPQNLKSLGILEGAKSVGGKVVSAGSKAVNKVATYVGGGQVIYSAWVDPTYDAQKAVQLAGGMNKLENPEIAIVLARYGQIEMQMMLDSGQVSIAKNEKGKEYLQWNDEAAKTEYYDTIKEIEDTEH